MFISVKQKPNKLAIKWISNFLFCFCADGPWEDVTSIVSGLLLPSQVAAVDCCTSLFEVSLGGRGWKMVSRD